ncbi:MAG: hypothetical protein ABIJ09_10935 [Pseudomonadota bacterium]
MPRQCPRCMQSYAFGGSGVCDTCGVPLVEITGVTIRPAPISVPPGAGDPFAVPRTGVVFGDEDTTVDLTDPTAGDLSRADQLVEVLSATRTQVPALGEEVTRPRTPAPISGIDTLPPSAARPVTRIPPPPLPAADPRYQATEPALQPVPLRPQRPVESETSAHTQEPPAAMVSGELRRLDYSGDGEHPLVRVEKSLELDLERAALPPQLVTEGRGHRDFELELASNPRLQLASDAATGAPAPGSLGERQPGQSAETASPLPSTAAADTPELASPRRPLLVIGGGTRGTASGLPAAHEDRSAVAVGLPCPDHQLNSRQRCVSCGRPLCDACHHFRINLRPWCDSCATAFQPGGAADVAARPRAGLVFWLKMGAVAGQVIALLAVGRAFGVDIRALTALLVVLLAVNIRMLFLTDAGRAQVEVEEVRPRIAVPTNRGSAP